MINLLMTQTGEGQQGSPIVGLLPFILLIVVFYFFIIRPQSRRQKAHQSMLKDLRKGDRVITTGGIIGSVVGVDEEKVVIRVGGMDGVKLEIAKGFVSQKMT